MNSIVFTIVLYIITGLVIIFSELLISINQKKVFAQRLMGDSIEEKHNFSLDEKIMFGLIAMSIFESFILYKITDKFLVYILWSNNILILISFFIVVLNPAPSYFRNAINIFSSVWEHAQSKQENLTPKSPKTLKQVHERVQEITTHNIALQWKIRLLNMLSIAPASSCKYYLESELLETEEIIRDLKQNIGTGVRQMYRKYYLYFGLVLLFFIIFSSLAIKFGVQSGVFTFQGLDNPSIADCMYFVLVTIYTVGYGDIYPKDYTGKVFIISSVLSLAFTFYVLLNLLTSSTTYKIEKVLSDVISFFNYKRQSLSKTLIILKYKQYHIGENTLISIFQGVKNHKETIQKLPEIRKNLDEI
jgi:alkylhydroperoxidase/carboxymuconolactone decarboxylase family protein YurZ